MTKPAGEAVAAITRLPIERVHPDPLQPRKNADSDLKDSILHNGQQVPITVWPDASHGEGHFTILNGERRWRACAAAEINDIDAMIVEEPNKVQRLMKQIVTNQGKPLTPIEEAFAFRQIMTDAKISQNELAKRLGIPRSTVGDRIRLIEIHPAWLELIEQGKLQVAHAAFIHRYRDVTPPEAHEKAVAHALSDKSYRIGIPIREGLVVQVDGQFKSDLFAAYSHWLRPLEDVPGYEGPIVKGVARYSYNSDNPDTQFAADRKVWLPILNKIKKENRAKGISDPTSRSTYTPREESTMKSFAKQHKLPTTTVKSKSSYETPDIELADDEFVVWGRDPRTRSYQSGQFVEELDGKFFLDHFDDTVKADSRVVICGSHSSLITKNKEAVELAKLAYAERASGIEQAHISRIKLFDYEDYSIFGPGSAQLIERTFEERRDGKLKLKLVCMALGLDYDSIIGEVVEEPEAEVWECLACQNVEDEIPAGGDASEFTVRDVGHPRFCVSCVSEMTAEDMDEHLEREAEEIVEERTSFGVKPDADSESLDRIATVLLAAHCGALEIPDSWSLKREVDAALAAALNGKEEESDEPEDGDEEVPDEELDEEVEEAA
jgi:ParB/RepB/Spo0J family partition protein